MKKITQPSSLSEKAYRIIKEEILNGDLKDNEELPEEKLAKALGISRTPQRCVTTISNRRISHTKKGEPAVVASFSEERSLEYMEIRSLLEVFNLEKISTKITEEHLLKLENNLAEQKQAIINGTYSDFIEKDRDFHLLLSSFSENSELKDMIQKVNTGVNRAFIILSKTVPQSAQPAYEEHLKIFQAIKNKDIIKAKTNMIIHLNNVEKRFLQGWNY